VAKELDTIIAAQGAELCVIFWKFLPLIGTPKKCTATLTEEQTIYVTATHREGVKTTAVVSPHPEPQKVSRVLQVFYLLIVG